MSFNINTNNNANVALMNLNSTGMEYSKSVQRLSTGLRISSGADDPSGLIAATSYEAQVAGLDQANRNVQNATNFAKTAASGLTEVSRLLQSARTLAVANGDASLDASAKQANQAQLDSIVASITRIGNNTQFGTKSLLNGNSGASASIIQAASANGINFQGVFNGSSVSASGNIAVTVTQAATQATVSSTNSFTAGTVTVGAGTFSVNGKTFTTSSTSTVNDVVSQVNSATGETGITAVLNSSTNKIDFKSINYGSDSSVTVSDSFGLLGASASASRSAGLDAHASVTVNGGTAATFDKGKGLQLKDSDGNTISLTSSGNAATGAQTLGYLSVNAANTFQIGSNAGQTSDLVLGDFRSAALGISSLDIVNNSSSAITSLDNAINQVSVAQGRIGSFIKNTLESQSRSLDTASQNMRAADSTIRDLDVAHEMTNFSRLQILQQSGISVLAQANQAPQSILKLLG